MNFSWTGYWNNVAYLFNNNNKSGNKINNNIIMDEE